MSEFLKNFSGEILEWEPLSRHTSYHIGEAVHYLVSPKSLDDLLVLSDFLLASKMPFAFLGLGSNILGSDEKKDVLVIKTKNLFSQITEEENRLYLGSGVSVTELIQAAKKNQWMGFEALCGIPGNMGGVIFMNAGTHLGEVKDLLLEVYVYSLKNKKTKIYTQEDLIYSYRKNHFLKPDELIIGAYFKKNISPETNAHIYSDFLKRRKETQPLKWPSCGSVFKNPQGHSAWSLIEKVGLKGKIIGEAQISLMHANWIVNLGNAKAQDVKDLIALVIKEVEEQLGITLEAEVRELHFIQL